MSVIIIIALVLIFIYGQARVYRKKWNTNLTVSVDFSTAMTGVNDNFEIIETAENGKWLPLPSLMIKYSTDRNLVAPSLIYDEKEVNVTDKFYYSDALPVLSNKKVIKKLSCHSKKRGVFKIDNIYMTAKDLCLVEEYHASTKCDANILIYPAYLDYGETEFPFNHMMGDILSRLRYIEDPFEFRGLRDYIPTDPTNHINWKASAKNDEYIVNEFNQTVFRTVRIFVNLTQYSGHFEDFLIEEELRLLVTIAAELLGKGFLIGVNTNAVSVFEDKDIAVKIGTGQAHMELIHEAAAVINAQAKVPRFEESAMYKEFKETEDFVVLIGFDQSEAVQDAIRERMDEGKGTYWIIPTNNYVNFEIGTDLRRISVEWTK